MTSWRRALLSVAVAAATVATVSCSQSAAAATSLFNGDYSTGDFSQWPVVQTRTYNSSGRDYPPDYSARIVEDPVKGNVARFEVRPGDVPEFGGGERAEVQGDIGGSGGAEGDVRWYRLATKFDPTFPLNHADLGWGVTSQWHSDTDGSPPLSWTVGQKNGFWSLTINSPTQEYSIFDTPLNPGTWHDVVMQVRWSTSPADGWIRLWLNGVQQKFLNGADTFQVATLAPGTKSVYYKEGMYRGANQMTDIVYHTGFRSADSEADLG